MNPAEAHEFTRLDLPRLEWEYALVWESETDGGTVLQRQPGGEWSPLGDLNMLPWRKTPTPDRDDVRDAKIMAYMTELDGDALDGIWDAAAGGTP